MTSAVDPKVPHSSTDVLIVGAGPVGLTLAVQLLRRGVDVVVVDKRRERAPYAKAIGVSPRTLEVFDAMGIVRAAVDASITMRGQIVYVDGGPPQTLDLALPDAVPYRAIAMPQYETERILDEAFTALGGRITRGVEFTGFTERDDTVTSTLHGAAGGSTVSSRYLVGCDGAHSLVRKGIGSPFEGDAFPEEYMLADVEVDWNQPAGYGVRAMHRTDGVVDDLLVAIPLPPDSGSGNPRYRISMLVPDDLATAPKEGEVAHGLESGHAPELHHIQAVLDRLAPESTTASNMRWSSVFRISHRLAQRYSSGRVFLAGDAAHIHPPTGAQGMNTGIQDATNLAWKLALAVAGRADPDLLDTYHLERHPVGEEVVGRTVRNARHGIGAGESDLTVALLREAQLLVAYPDSPICDGDGERAPDARGLVQDCSSVPLRVHDLLRHPNHTALLYAADADGVTAQRALAAGLRERYGHLVRAYVITSDAGVDASGIVVRDGAGEFAAAYPSGPRGGHVIRPDGYVGMHADAVSLDAITTHLARILG
ncbi:Monooxygenase [Rhodococcus sp. RD6.2]|jgi:2-polyprenyl-6-methoxyphenol hydroxylase-like FAD-dependent oxidoreductase|uniref:FAD-dependent oxidoreductase n=1 Tax=Rhodococcus sp. RD6.2 TaxID=260936 RepID=UPI00063B2B34|nr:FAD-dependent oxidoreductase [Rhodococcus sp. RD6.2]CRK52964.1 Monooxygenase [Rhodococcus sp. RD6.2]